MIHLTIQALAGLAALYCAIEAANRWGFHAPMLYLGFAGLLATILSLMEVWP